MTRAIKVAHGWIAQRRRSGGGNTECSSILAPSVAIATTWESDVEQRHTSRGSDHDSRLLYT